MLDTITTYTAELTDAWRSPDGGWDANYAWVRRASGDYQSTLAAVRGLKADLGISGARFDLEYDDGSTRCYKQRGAAILLFITAEY